jgi:hypothetical protein
MHKIQFLASTTIDSAQQTSSVNLENIDNYAIQVIVSAVNSPSGITVTLQASNDDTNWIDIADTDTDITETGSVMYDVTDPGYKYVRLDFTRTSGNITASAILTGRERRV